MTEKISGGYVRNTMAGWPSVPRPSAEVAAILRALRERQARARGATMYITDVIELIKEVLKGEKD